MRARGRAAVLVLALVAGACAPTPAPVSPAPLSPTAAAPTLAPSAAPTPTPSPVATATPTAVPTPSPSASPAPTPAAGPAGRPTRVAVPGLDIDLPVVNPPKRSTFPLCDVAEFFRPPTFQHPGAGGVTYIYAHAREGMFLPILRRSQQNRGRSMIGGTVFVWTARNYLYRYRIVQVRRFQASLDWAYGLPPNSLVLQTSETPYRDGTKVMLVARQVGDPVRATLAESRPTPRPVACS